MRARPARSTSGRPAWASSISTASSAATPSQWKPNLFRNTTPIYPYVDKPGWNLTTAMADDAIHWLNQMNDIDPDLPFFLYYVPGGTHAPHHPTPEWIKKISDMHLFDNGWNALRDQIFDNQKRLGVIPQDAKLTPWPDEPAEDWDTLSPTKRNCSSARPMSTPPTWPTPTTRSAASSRRSKTWASSTTR